MLTDPNSTTKTASGRSDAPAFIDAYAGCGGLSLGLMRAGWQGLFAIERDPFAFGTLETTLLGRPGRPAFNWPDWLPRSPTCATALAAEHRHRLRQYRGSLQLLAGGPPCQGFSSAGRRNAADPRNAQVQTYLDLVEQTEPEIVLLENVRGITIDFGGRQAHEGLINYAEFLREALGSNYYVFWSMIDASEFGVPQARVRFFLVGLRKAGRSLPRDPFEALRANRQGFLRRKGLISPVSSSSALSDLEVARNGRTPSPDGGGYDAIAHGARRTHYQRLIQDGHDGPLADTRLARHRPDITQRFSQIISTCNADGRLNVSLGRKMREALGIKKMALRVLDPDRPSPTITSMPDDLLHYREARTLTVRENARLQSFPDWFEFRGKYTTGGDRRRREIPRFTQVANAVPPLLAEAIGATLLEWRDAHLISNLQERCGTTSARPSVEGSIHQHGDVGKVVSMLDEFAS